MICGEDIIEAHPGNVLRHSLSHRWQQKRRRDCLFKQPFHGYVATRLSRQSVRRPALIERGTMLLRGQFMALETFGDTQVAKPLIVVGDHEFTFSQWLSTKTPYNLGDTTLAATSLMVRDIALPLQKLCNHGSLGFRRVITNFSQ